MRKLPTLLIAISILLSVLLGIMMFSVDSEDADSILSTFNNMSDTVIRPISATEVRRQLEQLQEESVDNTGTGSSNVTTIGGITTINNGNQSGGGSANSNPTQHGNTTFYNTPPQDGKFSDDAVYAAGLLQYICQGDWWSGTNKPTLPIWNEILGASGKTVQRAGCYFCSLSMASAYYRGREVTEPEFKTHVSNTANFGNNGSALAVGNNVLNAYSAGVSISGDTVLSVNDVKNLIDSNRPPIIHFTGVTSAGYYTGTGHFAFIVGYSDSDGCLILYDPGHGPNKAASKILTYTEYTNSSGRSIYIRTFS